MTNNVPNEIPSETPNTQTQQTGNVPTPNMVKECLKIVEEYRRSEWDGTSKAGVTHGLILTLASTMPELTNQEFNDSPTSYLLMLEQHDHSVQEAGGNQGEENCKTEEVPRIKQNKEQPRGARWSV